MKHRSLMYFLVTFLLLGYNSVVFSSDEFTSTSQLNLIKVKGVDKARILSSTDFSRFDTISIDVTSVNFQKYWLKDFRFELSEKERQKVKTRYADILSKSLKKAFNRSAQYQVTQEQSDLSVIAKLTNLRVEAPHEALDGVRDVLVDEFASATLELQIIDNKTGLAIADFKDFDRAQTRFFHKLEFANRVTNTYRFRKLTDRWSKRVAKLVTAKEA